MKRFYIIIDSRGHASERLRTDVNPPVAKPAMWIFMWTVAARCKRGALEKAL